ncbi:hypothetical protein GCM10022277_02940 [Litoribacillus peritrichatus]|uniref:Uncharacterized protein n=1 Tax=Litoribacillus peritrichatus TaxID=718191 RepID=A0ABP7M0X1_9GAMM
MGYLQVAAGQGEEKAALQYASAMIEQQYGVPCDDKLVIRLLKQAALNANVLAAQKLLDFLADRGLTDQISAQEVERISLVADLAELNIR